MKNYMLNEEEELIIRCLLSERYCELKGKENTRDENVFRQLEKLYERFNKQ